jgi:adenylate cyclase class 2
MILAGFPGLCISGVACSHEDQSMLEIEQKYAGVDFALLERRLAEWGATLAEEHVEADHYVNAPDRDFARTDEVLRLRRIGPANFFTYKGPKRDSPVKARTELEAPLAPGEEAARKYLELLGHLGYRPTAVVRKRRRSYKTQRGGFALTICLDEVDGLGRFAEVEVMAEETQLEAARSVLAEAAAALGLTAVERRSYLGLVLASQSAHSGESS